jgi:hypothetical protein
VSVFDVRRISRDRADAAAPAAQPAPAKP